MTDLKGIHSDSFLESGRTKQRSAFLITTSRSVIVLDGISATGTRISTGQGLYYGITRDLNYIYVAARNRLVSSTTPSSEERGEILVLDHCLKHVNSLSAPFPMRDLHQILAHEGKLWATCAFDNMIAVFDGQEWRQWFPSGQAEKLPADVNHFNSLSVIENNLCLVAHNWGPSMLMLFDLPKLRPIRTIELGLCTHNAWMDREELMICSSDDSCILGINGTRVETGGFPRGIACFNDEVYVGVSERAERSERDFSNASILAFDRQWQRLRTIELPHEGMVLDLMPVDFDLWRLASESGNFEPVSFPIVPYSSK